MTVLELTEQMIAVSDGYRITMKVPMYLINPLVKETPQNELLNMFK